MKRFGFIAIWCLLLFIGCDRNADRISRLEKENQELKARNAAVEYDLQAKCSKEAKQWFAENWNSEKSTLLLTQTNHYNRKKNKCFIVVEFHFGTTPDRSSWVNDISLWDVHENAQVGMFSLHHSMGPAPDYELRERLADCRVFGQTCKSMEEFNAATASYMQE